MCVQRTCYEQLQKVFAELLMDQGVPNFLHKIHIVVFVSAITYNFQFASQLSIV